MQTQNVSIVSVHPDPDHPLALDVKDILTALGPHLQQWVWSVRNLEWLGECTEQICRKVEAAGQSGLWMTSQDLVNNAAKVYQTIEGEFLAFPNGVNPKTVNVEELNLRAFPGSRAELAIVAVDGCYFDVYAKNTQVLIPVKQFKDVREVNNSNYFW